MAGDVHDYSVIISDPTGKIYGFPTYRWGEGPPSALLATRRQLAAMGLRKGGQDPVAQILRPRRRRPHEPLRAWLYDVSKAKKQFKKTPAKLAAVQTAANSRKKCDQCGSKWPQLQYVPRGGICETCRDIATYGTADPGLKKQEHTVGIDMYSDSFTGSSATPTAAEFRAKIRNARSTILPPHLES